MATMMICLLEIRATDMHDIQVRYLEKCPQPKQKTCFVRSETRYFGANPILPGLQYYEREIAANDDAFLFWETIGLWLARH